MHGIRQPRMGYAQPAVLPTTARGFHFTQAEKTLGFNKRPLLRAFYLFTTAPQKYAKRKGIWEAKTWPSWKEILKLPSPMAGFKRRQPPSLIWVHNKAGAERRVYTEERLPVWQENKHSASHMLTFRLCIYGMLLYSVTIIAYRRIDYEQIFGHDFFFFYC